MKMLQRTSITKTRLGRTNYRIHFCASDAVLRMAVTPLMRSLVRARCLFPTPSILAQPSREAREGPRQVCAMSIVDLTLLDPIGNPFHCTGHSCHRRCDRTLNTGSSSQRGDCCIERRCDCSAKHENDVALQSRCPPQRPWAHGRKLASATCAFSGVSVLLTPALLRSQLHSLHHVRLDRHPA